MATMKRPIKKAQSGTTAKPLYKGQKSKAEGYAEINKLERQRDSLLGESDRKFNDADKVMKFKKYARIKNSGKETPKTKVVDSIRSSGQNDITESVYKKMEREGIQSAMNRGSYYKTGGAVKKKMKNGGSLSGLKASTKRVGSVDPKGAFTKVQKKTLAGAKGKASLTKDKQLGATKMAKSGAKVSKKK
jgi:hypothetical protein